MNKFQITVTLTAPGTYQVTGTESAPNGSGRRLDEQISSSSRLDYLFAVASHHLEAGHGLTGLAQVRVAGWRNPGHPHLLDVVTVLLDAQGETLLSIAADEVTPRSKSLANFILARMSPQR